MIVKKKLINIINLIKWTCQALLVRFNNLLLNEQSIDIDFTNQSIYILVPHADDELLGCYSILMSHERVKVIYLGFTGDDTSVDNQKIRFNEFSNLCKSLGKEYIAIDIHNRVGNLHELLIKDKPEIIFTTSFIDWNTEHVLLNKILITALGGILNYDPLIGLYQISVPLPSKWQNYVIKLDRGNFNNKWKLFEEFYKSQSHMQIVRFKVESFTKVKSWNASESFALLEMSKWEQMFNTIDIDRKQLMKLYNNLYKKQKYVDKLISNYGD